jgi:hypothetical protein
MKTRVTVMPKDNAIVVDGVHAEYDLSHLDPAIHVLQWWPEGWGQIEYTVESQRPTVTTTDWGLVEPYVHIHEGLLHTKAVEEAEKARQTPILDLGAP